jgi:hypothetical protein
MRPTDENDLEKRITLLLKDLPPRKAPLTLESRVMAAIAAREARPWWRKSFASWPVAVRGVFLAGTATLAAATVWGLLRGLGAAPVLEVGEAAATPMVWWQQLRAAATGISAILKPLLPENLSLWFYSAIALVVAVYGSLLGLGATAYRLLWRSE